MCVCYLCIVCQLCLSFKSSISILSRRSRPRGMSDPTNQPARYSSGGDATSNDTGGYTWNAHLLHQCAQVGRLVINIIVCMCGLEKLHCMNQLVKCTWRWLCTYLFSREEARSRGFCVIMDGGNMLDFFQTTIIKALNQLQVGNWRTEETINECSI